MSPPSDPTPIPSPPHSLVFADDDPNKGRVCPNCGLPIPRGCRVPHTAWCEKHGAAYASRYGRAPWGLYQASPPGPWVAHQEITARASVKFCDGWCGPVIYDGVEHVLLPWPREGLERWVVPGHPDHPEYGEDCAPLLVHPEMLYLDLTREDVRDRFDRVYRLGVEVELRSMQKGIAFFGMAITHPLWTRERVGFFAEPQAAQDYSGVLLESLRDLDPNDDRKLADGSRLVDALARQKVAEGWKP